MYKVYQFRATYPKPIVSTSVCEVNNKLKWLMVEWLECQKNMVDQQITIHIQNPDTSTNQTILNHSVHKMKVYCRL